MVKELVQHAKRITGEEKVEDLDGTKLDILLSIPWVLMPLRLRRGAGSNVWGGADARGAAGGRTF
jgi:hypothetical protein